MPCNRRMCLRPCCSPRKKQSYAQQLAELTQTREQWLAVPDSFEDQGDMERRLADHPTAADGLAGAAPVD